MPLVRQAGGCAMAGWICAALIAGCASTSDAVREALRTPRPRPPSVNLLARDDTPAKDERSNPARSSDIRPVNYEELVETLSAPPVLSDDPLLGQAELSLAVLVAQVQQRNQSLQAALAAWGAAAQRYPQVVAFDDPTLQTMFAPA